MERKLNCVLLIDDDEPTNFLHQVIIEKSGCAKKIKTVQSGDEALAYLTHIYDSDGPASCPDLILLDINMPAMDGWEFLEKYKALNNEFKAKVMIVMLTTSLFPEDKISANEIPEISEFQNKPLTEEKLDGILKKFFENGQSPQIKIV
jgi:CheY-like chemotaxis protein